MFDKLLKLPAHRFLHFLGCAILAFGLPMNKVLMSIGTIWLVANVLLAGDFKSYKENLKKNPIFWFVIIILGFHLVGMLWSEDLGYAFRDMRSKLPFFAIPLALIALPLAKQFWKYVIYIFILSLLITSIINISNFYFITDTHKDYRDLSLFGSHIRYGILIVFGAMIALIYVFKLNRWSLLWFIVFLGLSYYTLIAQVFSAYIAYGITLIGLVTFLLSKIEGPVLRYSSIILLYFSVGFSTWKSMEYITNIPTVNIEQLEKHTVKGNPYTHHALPITENDNLVMVYLNEAEISGQWRAVSNISYTDTAANGVPINVALMRYMSALGLRKDAADFQKLTSEDIKEIENGATRLKSQNRIKVRMEALRNQFVLYKNGKNPDGSSLFQRVEHWKAAFHIIKNNFWLGVGTGDVQNVFDETYSNINSPLSKEYWYRSHNQFLTFFVSFGVFGFLVFLLLWVFIFKKVIETNNWIGFAFALVAFASFLPEDTLETQQGVTFVGFFLGFLPFLNINLR